MFVQWEGNLWRHIDEALTQQQPHGLAGVAQDLLEVFRHAVRRVFFTLIQNKLLHLLHTLHPLPTADTNNENLNGLTSLVSSLPQIPAAN